MSRSAVKSPRVYGGEPLQKAKVRALDGQTWKADQPGYYDSGYARPLATDGTSAQFVFLEDQDTAASTTDAWVGAIDGNTKFVGYVSSDDSDTTAQRAHIGGTYGIHVGSNVATVNVNETSNVAVVVEDCLPYAEPFRNDSTDNPGQVIFRYLTSVLDA